MKTKDLKFTNERWVSNKIGEYLQVVTELHLNHATEHTKFFKLKISDKRLEKYKQEILKNLDIFGSQNNGEYLSGNASGMLDLLLWLESFLESYDVVFEKKTNMGFDLKKERQVILKFANCAIKEINRVLSMIDKTSIVKSDIGNTEARS